MPWVVLCRRGRRLETVPASPTAAAFSKPCVFLLCTKRASTCPLTAAAAAVSTRQARPDFPADLLSYTSLVQQCGPPDALPHGHLLHTLIITESPFCSNTRLSSSLVQMYGQHAALEDALAVFRQVPSKNIYSWNIMIRVTVKLRLWLQARGLYRRMQVECVLFDRYAIVSILCACIGMGNLLEGKMLHAGFSSTELEADVIVGSALMNLYGSLSTAECALLMFEKVREPDLVSWNTLMAVCAQKGQTNVAFQLFEHVLQQGFLPNRVTFLAIIDACDDFASLLMGKKFHSTVSFTEHESDAFVLTSFMSMYGKCGDCQISGTLFDKMTERNVVAWNAIIAVHAHRHNTEFVHFFFLQMQEEGSLPDKVSFRTILCSCTGYSQLTKGKFLHIYIRYSGFDTDIIIGTALFSMYGRCGNLDVARELFDSLTDRDVVAWNAMIALYAQNEPSGNAILVLLEQMEVSGVLPDNVTLTSGLSACAGVSFESAEWLFKKVKDHNVSAWNAMLGACEQHGYSMQASNLVAQMVDEGISPDKVTYLVLLSLCCSLFASEEGNYLHAIITFHQLESEGALVSGLMTMYSYFCCLDERDWVFQAALVRDVVVFNSYITACVDHGGAIEVLEVWSQIRQEAVLPDAVTCIGIFDLCAAQGSLVLGKFLHTCIFKSDYMSDVRLVTSLFNMYNKSRDPDEAFFVFCSVIQHDAISWTAMISAKAEQRQWTDVVELFRQMQIEGVQPDSDLFANVISACADDAASTEGQILHCQACYCFPSPDIVLQNALINLYNKCGYIECAQREFCNMAGHDVFTYNVMIAGLAQHGYGMEALKLYNLMQLKGARINEYTLSSLLCACSHGGLVEEGWIIFIKIIECCCWRPSVEHFDCMVDLSGRSGQIEDAELLLQEIPLQPISVSYMTLLGAARVQTDLGTGGLMSKFLFELGFEDSACCVALSNLYAMADQDTEVFF